MITWSLRTAKQISSSILDIRRRRYRNGDRRRAEVLVSCPVKSRCCTELKPRWVDVGTLLKSKAPGSCRPCGIFKGGSRTPQGYVILPGKVLEHREIMERMLGRKLHSWESVHHKNGKRADNSPKNLELFSSAHGPGQRIRDLRAYLRTIPKKLGGLK